MSKQTEEIAIEGTKATHRVSIIAQPPEQSDWHYSFAAGRRLWLWKPETGNDSFKTAKQALAWIRRQLVKEGFPKATAWEIRTDSAEQWRVYSVREDFMEETANNEPTSEINMPKAKTATPAAKSKPGKNKETEAAPVATTETTTTEATAEVVPTPEPTPAGEPTEPASGDAPAPVSDKNPDGSKKTLKQMKADLAKAGEELAALKSGKPAPAAKPAPLTKEEKAAKKKAEKEAAAAAKKADKDAAKALAIANPPAPIVVSTRPVADIVADYIKPVEAGVGYVIAPGLPVEEWVAVVKHLDRQSEAINFMVGDLLVYGEKSYGETYKAAKEATGRSEKTLANWKSVAKGVAPEVRTLDVSFTHHAAVAALPAAKQTELLQKSKEENLSVAALTVLVKEAQPKPPTPPPAPPTTTKPATGSTSGVPEASMDADAKERYDKFAEKCDDVVAYLQSKDWVKLPQKERDAVRHVLSIIAEKYADGINNGSFTKPKK